MSCFQSNTGYRWWRTSYGRRVHMTDMSTRHLTNALRICNQRGYRYKARQIRQELDYRYNRSW